MQLDHDACYRVFAARDARFDGKLFVGVRTTGVYCRPICPAPAPKPSNVVFFGSAAAAHEAGFRPCLRCRPEVSPDFAAWHGTSTSVARALRLIEGGALDHESIDDFACRLGLGSRQLRRLFVEQLGAPPTAFAQTRRVHLAKRLIQETKLSMTEVALAAGYRSVRRFNETFQRIFARTPMSFRRDREDEGASGALVLNLPLALPYDWRSVLVLLADRAAAGVESVSSDRYLRTFDVSGARGAVCVGPLRGHRLRLEVRVDRLEALPEVLARVRLLFDLAADPDRLALQLGCDPLLSPLLDARPGLRVAGWWDPFELAVRTILGERLVGAAPAASVDRLVAAVGEPLAAGRNAVAGLTHLFPTAERLNDADLRPLSLPARRATALSSYARAIACDRSFVQPHAPIEDVVERLRLLPGFDGELASTLATRLVRHTDDFAGADPGLLERAKRWQPWRAYALVHLHARSAPVAHSGS